MQKKNFGEKLLALRKAKKVSQAEVADYINLTVAAYQNYENGRREAGYETIVKLADFYEVTTDYLLGREPLPDPFADLDLSKDNEKDVIEKYMSLPDETRAVLLNILIQLGEAAKGHIHSGIQQSTSNMITEKIVAFGGDNIEREVSEDEIIKRFEAIEEENRKRREKEEK